MIWKCGLCRVGLKVASEVIIIRTKYKGEICFCSLEHRSEWYEEYLKDLSEDDAKTEKRFRERGLKRGESNGDYKFRKLKAIQKEEIAWTRDKERAVSGNATAAMRLNKTDIDRNGSNQYARTGGTVHAFRQTKTAKPWRANENKF